ncbi:3'-5' RNA helicase YTHDC2 isoform X1 [Syngnathus scovelli]|uniref:3'-5' RNA helicase YTHDC2 isoform X1 n=1 Tax=Syngnathus scovelli TaxID=161590 RepID=UPI00210FF8CC|nr:3'-5' RNA helicase YTHDC2 isoform X1 [Syngnathus scovelli]XP_049594395.1 3'-5' RNA helicase YTHDC2 isoform X1 [Syngnathus scovelli]XP_049594396.1 3'-5' RNA helicase YTHDC2 isoform X1 [Syngnathus scovelli]XP_049594397.1 3'-5' RNA helicase YTHDC2 isoform X1 [Syngnathus scovelli]XP_049594398.1 3'-5' RNA helicase YTHDC2 isoform X1 [Syngnathus scovelli]XP_049594399.1 3'-5' RNA helicase YTHDC2 isoform X1 [Syngnathus scovelli]
MSYFRLTSKNSAKSQKAKKSSTTSRFKDIHINEEVKISINLALERFCYSDQKEMEFPSSLFSNERAFIHRAAQSLGFISKSKGKGSNRFLTIRKKNLLDSRRSAMLLTLSQTSLNAIHILLEKFPITSKEREDLQASSKSKLSVATQHDNSFDMNRPKGCLDSGISVVPPRRRASEFDSFRRALPVYEHEEQIVRLIGENKVVLIVGETGSGKTTQIPQFLLDDCSKKGECCRIFCTQPRRLAAITVAERVAAERGETIGKTVGYHIRLESRVSPKTLLTFCTTGVLLRTLMAGDVSLASVTHVIVDEVHERDGLTDFLLTKMLDVLEEIPAIKLVLSSASLDVDLFLKYFGAWSCPVFHLKGRQYEVKQHFLEDILKFTGFNNKEVGKNKEESQRRKETQNLLTKRDKVEEKISIEDGQNTHLASSNLFRASNDLDEGGTIKTLNVKGSEQLQPWLVKEMDTCIANIFMIADQEYIVQLFNLILYEHVNVNYMHSKTGATSLMVTAGRGFLAEMERLLNMGADINLKAGNGWTALDFAISLQQLDAVDLLQSSIAIKTKDQNETPMVQCASAEQTSEDQDLLKLYHHIFDDEFVDLDLIMDLLHMICSTTCDGAVLIFLPGYDDIVSLRDRILYDDTRFSTVSKRYQVFTLHSDMPSIEQKKAMKKSPPSVRKIILSTNIAETSITINDVVFVIDSGKVKEKSFDTISRISMLKTVWISKASALQRRGRAGRCQPGICFHLFSQLRFNNMQEFQVPQLLRMPLQELCLQTKLLTPSPVSEFLSKAPQPPTAHAVKSAVQILKTIDAMNENEDLTDLGFHLADLPVEPNLGKMVLCAVVLKCLDPILTIACTLGYRDPFILPVQGSQKRAALQCRKHFASNSFSDHMTMLRIFQAWQKARNDGSERSFCEKNYLSNATMDMILGMRTQLLRHLRATGFVRAHGESDIRDVNINSENWAVVKAALVAGMYPNLLHINPETKLPSSNKEKKVSFHPTSILNQSHNTVDSSSKSSKAFPTEWLVYDEMSRGNRIPSVRCCTLVTAITVAIFAGGSRHRCSGHHEATFQKDSPADDMSDSETEDATADLRIDEWLIFQTNHESAELVFDLRNKWHNLFIRRICCPSNSWSQQDEMTVQTLASVLTTEEHGAGLVQPSGIGQRPCPLVPERLIQNSKGNPKLTRNATDDRLPGVSGQCQRKPHSSDKSSLSKNYLVEHHLSSSNSTASVSLDSQFDSPFSYFSEKHCTKQVLPQPELLSARYFIMKSSNLRNIEISQQKGIWSTIPSNETKLTKALQENKVILIFSVQGSGHYQGYARMSSSITYTSCQDWGFGRLGGVFSVEWLCKENLPFQYTQHILNPLNGNKKVQISRDGQELDAQAGRLLLSLWERITK